MEKTYLRGFDWEDDFNKLSLNSRSKILILDALNFSKSFLDCENHWNLGYAEKKVKKFVKSCENSGYELKVFIDGNTGTKEADKKWRIRRENEVRKGERKVPQSLNIILGDIFAELGVDVNYSINSDNDDIIAAFANKLGGDILSRDNDFLRYKNTNYRIFTSFYFSKNKIVLDEENYNTYIGTKRNLLNPIPKTGKNFIDFMFITDDIGNSIYRRGNPSSLVKIFGNSHIEIAPLRQALYFNLGLKEPVLEIFPTWNPEAQQVEWINKYLEPSDKLCKFLTEPQDVYNYFFSDLAKPFEVPKKEWENHLFSLNAIICEMCSIVLKVPLITLLRQLPQYRSVKNIRKNYQSDNDYLKSNHTFKCKNCNLMFVVTNSEYSHILKKNWILPKKCKKCRILYKETHQFYRNNY